MRDQFDVVWAGERGAYLCADGPSLSMAARVAQGGESDPPPAVPRARRGFRAKGFRFRDQVEALVPVTPHRIGLAALAVQMEVTHNDEIACIGRALLTLWREGRIARGNGPKVRGQARWAYWKSAKKAR